MAVASPVRVTCPRCATPVTGDFKFCPACAFRLRPGSEDAQPPQPAERALSHNLLALGVALFLGMLIGVGVWIFRDRDPEHPQRPPAPPGVATVPAGDQLLSAHLAFYLKRVPEGTAWIEEDPATGRRLPLRVPPLDALLYEVTRGFYAEFHADLAERLDRGEPPPLALEALWRAETSEAQELARWYLGTWVAEFLRHLGPEAPPDGAIPDPLLLYLPEEAREEGGRSVESFENAVPFPWPTDLGLTLLAPPTWARLDRMGLITVEMPADTAALPVTQVAFPDALAFAEWLNLKVPGDRRFRLPVESEWVRIAHGDHPPSPDPDDAAAWTYPWGRSLLVQACNNADAYFPVGTPVLQPVDKRYRDDDFRGDHDDRTVDGIFNMAGNVREWTVRQSRVRQRAGDGYRASPETRETERLDRETAVASGGSYEKSLLDCTVSSRTELYRHVRKPDLGFRIVRDAPPL